MFVEPVVEEKTFELLEKPSLTEVRVPPESNAESRPLIVSPPAPTLGLTPARDERRSLRHRSSIGD